MFYLQKSTAKRLGTLVIEILSRQLDTLRWSDPVPSGTCAAPQVLGKVISRADGIALRVRKLALDHLMVPALFVQRVDAMLRKPWPVIYSFV